VEVEGDGRSPGGDDGQQHVAPPEGEEQAEEAAREREQRALGQQLADEPQAACAQREAHGHLFPA
jgi:hypothetical protein